MGTGGVAAAGMGVCRAGWVGTEVPACHLWGVGCPKILLVLAHSQSPALFERRKLGKAEGGAGWEVLVEVCSLLLLKQSREHHLGH